MRKLECYSRRENTQEEVASRRRKATRVRVEDYRRESCKATRKGGPMRTSKGADPQRAKVEIQRSYGRIQRKDQAD